MRIIELTLQGAQGEQRFAFQPGLNVIHEPNESVRRVLQDGLVTILFGPREAPPAGLAPLEPPARSRPKRKGSSSQKSKSPDKTGSSRFEGTLLLALDNDRKLQLRRSITANTNLLHVLDVQTGKDVSADFQHGQDFADRYFSSSREVFESTALIQPQEVRQFADAEEDQLAASLSQVLDSAKANISVHTAIQRIDRKLAEIGTVYSAGSLMAATCARRDELQQKRLSHAAAQRAAGDDQAQAEELAAETEVLQARLEILEHEATANELTTSRARLARFDDCQKQVEKIAAEQTALSEYKEFPVAAKERFFQLHNELTHLEKLQELLTNERNSLSLKLIATVEKTNSTGVNESIWELHSFEDFYALRTQWQATFEQILALETAKHGADAALEAAGLDASDRAALATLDLGRLEIYKAREAAIKAQEQEVEKLRVTYDEFQSRTQGHRRAGALSALAVLLAIAVGLFHLEGKISQAKVWGGVLPLLASVCALLLFMFLNYRWLLKSRQLAGDLLFAEKEYMDNYQDLREILGGFKVESLGELIRQRMLFMELGTASREHGKRAEEMARIERLLLPWMQPLGFAHIAPETLAAAEERLRVSHQLWQEKKNAEERLEHLNRQLDELQENRGRVSASLEKALSDAKISLPPGESAFQSYVQACQKREYLETLQSQRRQISALAEEILRGQTREQLLEVIGSLEHSLRRFAAPRLRGGLAETLSPAQIRERIEAIHKEINEKRQALAVNRERVRLRDHPLLSLAEIDEALALAEDEISRLNTAQHALQIARNNLLSAKLHVHNDFARRATAIINQQVEQLTNGKYAGARVDPSDFSVHLSARKAPSSFDQSEVTDPATERSVLFFLRLRLPALMAELKEGIPIMIETGWREQELRQSAGMQRVIETAARQQQVLCITQDAKTASSLRQKSLVGRETKLA